MDFSNDRSALEHFIFQKTIEVIARRAEPTPYDFILNGVLPEMLQAGYLQPDEPSEQINQVLSKYIGQDKVFNVISNPDNKGGTIWWFNEPSKYINYPDIPLSDRVNETVLSILRRRISVKLDDVVAELFRMYPNGLTPDPRKIKSILERYAYQSAGKWKLKDVILTEATMHTKMIAQLCKVAKRMNMMCYVGKREQPERLDNGQQLKDLSDYTDLQVLSDAYDASKIDRIAWIDCLLIKDNNIKVIFEVENSTNFINALMRASNVEASIPKYMIIPDERKDELQAYSDPSFRNMFVNENWKYLTYTELSRIQSTRDCSIDNIDRVAHNLLD